MIANFEATDNDFIDLRTLGKLQQKEVIAVKKDWRAKKLTRNFSSIKKFKNVYIGGPAMNTSSFWSQASLVFYTVCLII